MNIYAAIVLAALLGDWLLGLLADVLNLRAAAPRPPAEFRETVDPDAYRRSQEYLRATTRFGLIASTVALAAVLAFWFLGGFEHVDQLVRSLGKGSVWTGLLYIGALLVLRAMLDLPFACYETFVIEARFGFNKTRPLTFVADRLRVLGLAIVLGGPLLAGILLLFERAGSVAWLACWAVTALFILTMQVIVPIWIMPLFNRFTPLPEGELRSAILDLARRVGYPVSGVFIIDGSRRSTHSNAFVAGLGRQRRIALFDTLVARHPVPELVAIVAHEIGHWRKKHILLGTLIAIGHAGVMFLLLSVFLGHDGLFAAFRVTQPSVYAGLVLFGLLYAPVELLLAMLMNMLSRRNEYQADRFAGDATGAPETLARALMTLSLSNLSNLTPHPFMVFLHYSHPPVLQRIRALCELRKEQV